jgi:RNA polymerase sigma-70 factor (ECF subfamily)
LNGRSPSSVSLNPGTVSGLVRHMPLAAEHSLIQLAQEGDLDAFNRLVLEYQDAVYGVALRMLRNKAAAEDVTQEAFISAWRAIKSYRGTPARDVAISGAQETPAGAPVNMFRAWLLRIARNATYDHIRRSSRTQADSIDEDAVTFAETVPSGERGPEEWALTGELGRVISQGLGEVPEDQRMAIVLVDVQGYSYEEAAAAMETNIGTVKSRLNRGRSKMKDILRRNPELLPAQFRQKDMEK